MRETVTIYVPDGYNNAAEFLRDCQFEEVDRRPAWDANWNRSYEPVETRAKEIYDTFVYDGPGNKPAWTPGGNGIKQDEARHLAREELRAAGHNQPVKPAKTLIAENGLGYEEAAIYQARS
jgi:hypothetical protein